MIKIAHEAPKSIFKFVQAKTDYDYALVHLFEEDKEYYQQFKDAVSRGREVILDNSIFELEEAFDAERFAYWVKELKPEWYIVPDVLEGMTGTINNFINFEKDFPDLPGKSIGVVQGKSYEEIYLCYNFMVNAADMVAISFDYSFFEEMFPDEPTKYHKWMKGRQELIRRLEEDGIIDQDKPHHLLGCGLPQEFAYYKNKRYIYSCDTSNPVVHGMKGIKYDRLDYGLQGLKNKESTKLFTLINSQVENKDEVLYNIQKFRENVIV